MGVGYQKNTKTQIHKRFFKIATLNYSDMSISYVTILFSVAVC